MKRLLMFMSLFCLLIVGVVGCNQDVFKTADTLYIDIKTVVTDPAVRPFIPAKTMDRLATAEQVYLAAYKLRKKKPETEKPIELLLACANEVLLVVEDLNLGADYDAAIAAIRISTNILRNRIRLE